MERRYYPPLLIASTLMVLSPCWAEPIHSELSEVEFMLWGLAGPWISVAIALCAGFGICTLLFAFMCYIRSKTARKPLLTGAISLALAVGLFIIQGWARRLPEIFSNQPCASDEISAVLDNLPCSVSGAFVSADSLTEYIESLCQRNPEDGATEKSCHRCFEQAKRDGIEVLTTLIKFQILEPQSLDDFRDSMTHAEVNSCESSSS
jgi:hypothetical protein